MGKLNNLQLPDETTTGQSRVAKTTNEEKLGNGLLPGADADIMDFITVRKSSKREAVSVYFDEDVPYAKSFGFVKVGDPVVFNSSSNYISIGLNQGSFKAKYGVKAGLDWKVTITKK